MGRELSLRKGSTEMEMAGRTGSLSNMTGTDMTVINGVRDMIDMTGMIAMTGMTGMTDIIVVTGIAGKLREHGLPCPLKETKKFWKS